MVENCRPENYRCRHYAVQAICSRTSSFWPTTTPTPWPLSAEGTIATRLMAAIIQKIVCIGPMKRLTLGAPDGTDKPAKTACRTLMGMLVASTANEIERLRRAPVVTRVADIPEATPPPPPGAAPILKL